MLSSIFNAIFGLPVDQQKLLDLLPRMEADALLKPALVYRHRQSLDLMRILSCNHCENSPALRALKGCVIRVQHGLKMIDIRSFNGVTDGNIPVGVEHFSSVPPKHGKPFDVNFVAELASDLCKLFLSNSSRDPEAVYLAWEHRLYWSNDGGSHRFAAVYTYATERTQSVIAEYSLAEFRLSLSHIEAARKEWLLVVWDLTIHGNSK